MTPTRFLLALTALLGVVVLPASPAWAHNSLAEATPAKETTLTKAPKEVRLRFLQKLNPDHTTISVADAAQQMVPAAAPEVDGATGSIQLTSPLTNGTYTVAYRVVSRDGHTVQGSYKFTVAAPATAVAPSASSAAPSSAPPSSAPPSVVAPAAATVVAEPAAAESGLGTGGIVLLVVGLLVVAGGVGFVLMRRRS